MIINTLKTLNIFEVTVLFITSNNETNFARTQTLKR